MSWFQIGVGRNTFVVPLSQRVQEVREGSVPGVRVVQVTRVSRAPHHHHSVIGQVAEVPERRLAQLSVLVPVNYQGGDLEETQDKRNVLALTGDVRYFTSSLRGTSCSFHRCLRGNEGIRMRSRCKRLKWWRRGCRGGGGTNSHHLWFFLKQTWIIQHKHTPQVVFFSQFHARY